MARKKNKKDIPYEKRYKYKLNMLGSGQTMLKISGILFALGITFYYFSVPIVYISLFSLAFFLFLLLLILVAIELHQDKVLYELAKSHDSDIK